MIKRRSMWVIPEETARVARATFPQGNSYTRLRDELGPLYRDSEFVDLFVWRGRPAEAPGFLAMVTVMQFAEGLTDRQAAEAVRSRIDWKYVLGLELTDTGFAHSILCDYRKRLVRGEREMHLLDGMLAHLQAHGWLKARGQQRTDSTHVLAVIRALNRLECVGETMRNVLNDLASVAPEWLVAQVTADWFDLYGPRFEGYRLPQERAEREALQVRIGQDGVHLLQAIYAEQAPDWLRELPSVQILRQVWIQQYYLEEESVYVRTKKQYGLPPAKQLIQSPYDPEARNRTKRSTNWTGYACHLTETCDEESPHLITHVATTPATTADNEMTGPIQTELADKGLLPAEHLVDTGYADADNFLDAQKAKVDLVAPVLPNPSWQAQDEEAFDLSTFFIDWDKEQVTCPQGNVSISWKPHETRHGTPMVAVTFSRSDCMPCPVRQRCTRAKSRPRGLTFQPKEQFLALRTARQRQETDAFHELYKLRAGVEGAISQAVRAFGLRQSRYVGLRKTHLQHVATAAAMNLTRIAAWLDDAPQSRTRQSRFAALRPT